MQKRINIIIMENKELSKIDLNKFDLDLMLFLKKGNKIRIKPENRGKFTAKAKRHNMGVQEYARYVLANKEKYPSSTVKQANFARNFGGRKKK